MTSVIPFPATIIGLMSGTSADGVDAAWLTTDGRAQVQAGASLFVPYGDALRADILALMQGRGDEAAIAAALTDVHIAAVRALMQKTNARPDAVGFHGQTIRHAPERGITVQIGEPARMAAALGIPVVADFRSNDVRHGGQGAPLVPLYHAALCASLATPVLVVNIGGVANVTWVGESSVVSRQSSVVSRQLLGEGEASRPSEPSAREAALHGERSSVSREQGIIAFDCGPGNALLDDWVHHYTGERYDAGGALAARGRVDAAMVAEFLRHPFFAQPVPKSLDRNAFHALIPALHQQVAEATQREVAIANGAATLTAMTAAAIAHSLTHLPQRPQQMLIAGGGRHNPTLMRMLRAAVAGLAVDPVEAVGWDGDMLEAQAFAYLAARSLQGLPLSLPTTTGARAPVTGGVVYGIASFR